MNHFQSQMNSGQSQCQGRVAMRRIRYLTAVGIPATLVGLLLLIALVRPDDGRGVTWENFNRLRNGMTQSDVEAIFGERAVACETAVTLQGEVRTGVFYMGQPRAMVEVDFADGALDRKHWTD